MRLELVTYFTGEKLAGLLAAAIGAVAIGVAVVLLQPRWGLRPLALTVGILGLLEIGVGLGLYLRTGPQTARLEAQLAAAPEAMRRDESARMTRVQTNFARLEVGWLVLIVASAVAAVALKSARPALSGVALGVLVHASFLLAFDLVAERRGAVYLAALRGEAAPTASP